MSWVIRCSLLVALFCVGCGPSSASTSSEGEPATAEPTSGGAGGETGGADDLGRARGTNEHRCEIRRSQADCTGCTATYSSDPSPLTEVSSCTRTVEGVASDCAAICCHTCPRE